MSSKEIEAIAETEKSDTQNEEATVPQIKAVLRFSKSKEPVFATYPINAPAKVSPAPVGSTTFFNG